MPFATDARVAHARARLDAWVRELMQWHFDPATGCPFWLEFAAKRAGWDPRDARSTATTTSPSSAPSRTSGCAAARCAAGCPRATPARPIYVFETGGSTGVPKSRINIDDFRIDYELFSETLPDEAFPRGRRLAHGRARAARAACGWPSSTWPSTAAASASWSTSTRAG